MCVYTYIRIYVYESGESQVYVSVFSVYTYIHTYIHTYISVSTHTCIHIYRSFSVYTYIHTYIRAYIAQ